jgi:hypothetical protein
MLIKLKTLLLAVVVVGASGPASGSGLFLENEVDFLLLENGDFLLLE